MVCQVHKQGKKVAPLIEHFSRSPVGHRVERPLIGHQFVPLRITFIHANGDSTTQQRQGVRSLNARDVVYLPLERIHQRLSFVGRALIVRGLDHHHQHITACRVGLGHKGVIQVVSRIAAQLRRSRVEVAHFKMQTHHKTRHPESSSHHDRNAGPFALGKQIEESPHHVFFDARRFAILHAALCSTLADTGKAQQHRQQCQVSENQYRDADARGDRQFLNNADVNDQQHGKTNRVT
ncbi:hypothetical protein D3C72_812200 [compost metagenome]